MCHRYNIKANLKQVAELFPDLSVPAEVSLDPQRDFYPTSLVPVVRLSDDAGWELVMMEWGLLPFWWKPSARSRSRAVFQRKTFNARGETIDIKPSYRDAFRKRRCLIPASEFYEGPKDHAAWFRQAESPVMTFAGLWEHWRSDEEDVESCTIVTTDANALVAEYHPRRRMPVILTDDAARRRWMDPDVIDRAPLAQLLEPIDVELMSHRPAD